AAALEAAGGCQVARQSALSPDVLAQSIVEAMDNPDRLAAMAAAAKHTGRPDAARLLADLTEAIASGERVVDFRKGLGS
ncbi:MAG: UDP-N-acetylglucosamine--N-acetylmuramyl-(pentapeptide) pyrophosphoryl-undecaprenol N-acetylglucosamine transferase, partial [Rhizobiaceae bacterium]